MREFRHLDFNTDTGWGYLPPTKEVFDVFDYVRAYCDPQFVLEIGYYAGHSTSYMGEIFENAQIISCCPNHPKYRETCLAVEKAHPNVKVIGVKSPEIYEYILDYPVDFVFIDGAHTPKNVHLDLSVAFSFDTVRYVLMDNSDQSGVKRGLYHYRDKMKKINTWTYEATNKGVTKTNEISLYMVLSLPKSA